MPVTDDVPLLNGLGRSWPGKCWRRGQDLQVPTQMLALAAQMVLCAAPLLVATSAVVRRADGHGLGEPLARYLGLHGAAARDFMSLFAGSRRVSMAELVVGLLLGAAFGTGIAATQQRGFETLWSLPRAPIRQSWRWLVWLAGLGVYLAVVLGDGQLGHHTDWRLHLGALVRVVLQLVASLVFYCWSQHLLLMGRVSWRRLLPGAAAMSLGTTLLVLASGYVLPGQLTEQVNDYGPVGATFVLSVWLVTLSAVILGGALIGVTVAERHIPAQSEEATLQPQPL
jgi:membrane protein